MCTAHFSFEPCCSEGEPQRQRDARTRYTRISTYFLVCPDYIILLVINAMRREHILLVVWHSTSLDLHQMRDGEPPLGILPHRGLAWHRKHGKCNGTSQGRGTAMGNGQWAMGNGTNCTRYAPSFPFIYYTYITIYNLYDATERVLRSSSCQFSTRQRGFLLITLISSFQRCKKGEPPCCMVLPFSTLQEGDSLIKTMPRWAWYACVFFVVFADHPLIRFVKTNHDKGVCLCPGTLPATLAMRE
jgi:hypothetical protein